VKFVQLCNVKVDVTETTLMQIFCVDYCCYYYY